MDPNKARRFPRRIEPNTTDVQISSETSRSSRKFLSPSRLLEKGPVPFFQEPYLNARSPILSSQTQQIATDLLSGGKANERAMDVRVFELENPLLSTLQHLMDIPDETEKAFNAPTRTYVRDAKAMASTPVDVKELPSCYVFVIDMPGVKSGEIKVQVEGDNMLIISGERKREEDKEGKYLRMERRMGKFMRKFSLPENANTDAISAVCQDGVLSVTVQKLPPPEPKKPKTIEVKVA